MIQFILASLSPLLICICKDPIIVELRHCAAIKIQTAFRKYRERLTKEAQRTADIVDGVAPSRRRSVVRRRRRRTEANSSSSEEIEN
jgi:hypothetical protein